MTAPNTNNSQVTSQNESTPETPPTSETPAPPPTNQYSPAYIEALEATLREQAQSLKAQNEAIARLNEQATVGTRESNRQYDPENDRVKFLSDPRSIVREEVATLKGDLEQTVKPLLDFVQEFRGQNTATRIKSKVANDPRFSSFAKDKHIDAYVDQALASVPAGTQISEALVTQAYVAAIGAQTAGFIPKESGSTNTPPSPSNPRPPVTNPPYIPPSSAAPPRRAAGEDNLRDLTENEERMRRERNMTKKDFLAWLDTPADQVVNTKIGKPAGGQ